MIQRKLPLSRICGCVSTQANVREIRSAGLGYSTAKAPIELERVEESGLVPVRQARIS